MFGCGRRSCSSIIPVLLFFSFNCRVHGFDSQHSICVFEASIFLVVSYVCNLLCIRVSYEDADKWQSVKTLNVECNRLMVVNCL